MDRNDYYGGDSASLNLTQVRPKFPFYQLNLIDQRPPLPSSTPLLALPQIPPGPDRTHQARQRQGLQHRSDTKVHHHFWRTYKDLGSHRGHQIPRVQADRRKLRLQG